MSAATTYQQSNVANVISAFIASDEAELIASARAGNSTAFESLVMPHWDALLRVTQRILRNREDAEDAVQTAVLDAFRNFKSFQGRSRFSTWLTRIATNTALMRLRVNRRKRETSLDEMPEGENQPKLYLVEKRPNPEQEYLSNESWALLEKGLAKLKPQDVEVLRMRNVQELSAKEAAGLLRVPVGTVKARLHRARAKLTRYTQSMRTYKRKASSIGGRRFTALSQGSVSA